MSSIKADVVELQSIKIEIKSLNEKRKKLHERAKVIEKNITDYLKAKNQPGLKHQDLEFRLEEKEKPVPRKNKERDTDAMAVLERYGIQDSSKVFQELMQARKGTMVTQETLKMKVKKVGKGKQA